MVIDTVQTFYLLTTAIKFKEFSQWCCMHGFATYAFSMLPAADAISKMKDSCIITDSPKC